MLMFSAHFILHESTVQASEIFLRISEMDISIGKCNTFVFHSQEKVTEISNHNSEPGATKVILRTIAPKSPHPACQGPEGLGILQISPKKIFPNSSQNTTYIQNWGRGFVNSMTPQGCNPGDLDLNQKASEYFRKT